MHAEPVGVSVSESSVDDVDAVEAINIVWKDVARGIVAAVSMIWLCMSTVSDKSCQMTCFHLTLLATAQSFSDLAKPGGNGSRLARLRSNTSQRLLWIREIHPEDQGNGHKIMARFTKD